jgi:hypothetical protein
VSGKRETDLNPELENVVALLARTPRALDGLMRGLPETLVRTNEGGDTMTACDVVAHLIDADRLNWIPRAQCILEHGEAKAFAGFDRFAYIRESQGKPVSALLEEFAALRAERLDDLRALQLKTGDFERVGKHPALGAVTLGNLLSTWAVHDLTHLHQITRILAKQFEEAVGPFERFVGVLHCNGHGASA